MKPDPADLRPSTDRSVLLATVLVSGCSWRHSEDIGQSRLRHPRRSAHLCLLVTTYVGLPALACRPLACGLRAVSQADFRLQRYRTP